VEKGERAAVHGITRLPAQDNGKDIVPWLRSAVRVGRLPGSVIGGGGGAAGGGAEGTGTRCRHVASSLWGNAKRSRGPGRPGAFYKLFN